MFPDLTKQRLQQLTLDDVERAAFARIAVNNHQELVKAYMHALTVRGVVVALGDIDLMTGDLQRYYGGVNFARVVEAPPGTKIGDDLLRSPREQ